VKMLDGVKGEKGCRKHICVSGYQSDQVDARGTALLRDRSGLKVSGEKGTNQTRILGGNTNKAWEGKG